MINTCSIKLLTKAYIGKRVRMTGGKDTVAFNNIPMSGIKISDYCSDGFEITHPNLPKEVWVDFAQLPLTRLRIINGTIEDELTFVENIVRHEMQLIRTLDTEYIDLLYKEKALTKIADQIIPLTKARIGDMYKGARCEHGTEMVYLGSWYCKQTACYGTSRAGRGGYYSEYDYAHHIKEDTVKRAFFGCLVGKKWSIINYAPTNKSVKDLICLNKTEQIFTDKALNREAIIYNSHEIWSSDDMRVANAELALKASYPCPELSKHILKAKYSYEISRAYKYLSDNKDCDLEALTFFMTNSCNKFSNQLIEGKGYRSYPINKYIK